MILINLLPHREAARKRRRELFYAALGASAFAGALVAGGIYLWFAAQIANQQERNQLLTSEIKRLETQIKDIATLQEEIAALRARQQAVEDLQADRNMPVHLLNELVRLLPDGVYLTSMKQTSENVAITGVAQSNERVSELLRNLSVGPWIIRPELVEIVAANINVAPKEQRRVSNFQLRVKLARPADAAKAAAAAAPASGAVAPGAPPTTAASAAKAAASVAATAAVAAVLPAPRPPASGAAAATRQ